MSIWELVSDALTASEAVYLPFRIGYTFAGTLAGSAVVSVMILVWMSTWVGEHEILTWIMIIAGYLIDFGPCIYRLMLTWKR